MELTHQVCNLDLAKRLKALNVKQESLFYWCDKEQGKKFDAIEVPWFIQFGQDGWVKKVLVSAFTCSELGEMLPFFVIKDGKELSWECYPSMSGWEAWLQSSDGHGKVMQEGSVFQGDTEADARAKMLCYLIEQNLISKGKKE